MISATELSDVPLNCTHCRIIFWFLRVYSFDIVLKSLLHWNIKLCEEFFFLIFAVFLETFEHCEVRWAISTSQGAPTTKAIWLPRRHIYCPSAPGIVRNLFLQDQDETETSGQRPRRLSICPRRDRDQTRSSTLSNCYSMSARNLEVGSK